MRYFININRLFWKTALALTVAINIFIMPLTSLAQQRPAPQESATATPNEADASRSARGDSAKYQADVRERLSLLENVDISAMPERLLAPPPNDNFASATVLPPDSSGTEPGTNVEATGEVGEPNHAGASSPLNSVWYRWTAPSNLSMTFETIPGTMTDTTLAVYTGSAVGALTLIAENDEIGVGAGGGTPSRVTFIANAGTTYRIAVDGYSSVTGTFSLRWHINYAETLKQFNYNGDGFSDFAVFRSSNNNWYIRESTSGTLLARNFGLSTDALHAGDFDGDGKTDIAVYRPSTSTFYALRSTNGTLISLPWGVSGDVPVQGDFDGDDVSDFTVWRPSNGTFYVRKSTDGALLSQPWGQNGDFVAPGDYDGDGKTDFAVERISGGQGTFYILKSSDLSLVVHNFGLSTDLIVPGDYDNDGKNDVAVYRGSTNTFYALRSTDGSLFAVAWGSPGDILAPGDYGGDFSTDVAVFRPSDGTFYVRLSGSGGLNVMTWGLSGDRPIANSAVR